MTHGTTICNYAAQSPRSGRGDNFAIQLKLRNRVVLLLAASILTSLVAAQPATQTTKDTSPVLGGQVTSFVETIRPADRNAAIQYMRLAASLTGEVGKKISEVSLDKLSYDEATFGTDPGVVAARETIAVSRPQDWLAASRLAKCNFENATEDGFEMLLPHLGQMRSGARMLRFFARDAFVTGNAMKGAEYIEGMMRIGNHATGDGVLISSLVGIAVGSLALTEMQGVATTGKLTSQARDHLLSVLDLVYQDDPMLAKESILAERELMLNHLNHKFTGANAGAELDETNLFGNDDTTLTQLRRQKLRNMDEAALKASVQQAKAVYNDMIEAWSAEDYKAQFAAIETKVQKEEYGLIAAIFAPSIKNVKASQVKFVAEIEITREALKNAKLSDAQPVTAE